MSNIERLDGITRFERLLTALSDGVEGYRVAAAKVISPHLHSMLQRNEVEREEISSVVTNVLVELGVKHDHRGSTRGAIHRGWLGALAITHADEAIVHECARGDQLTLAAFAEALSHDLPPEIRERLQVQSGRVEKALEHLAAHQATQPTASPPR